MRVQGDVIVLESEGDKMATPRPRGHLQMSPHQSVDGGGRSSRSREQRKGLKN
jgi:hypothetical protein